MDARTLKEAWEQYKQACYGNRKLSPVQHREVQQAWLTGVHWLNTQKLGDAKLQEALIERLTDIGSFPDTN